LQYWKTLSIDDTPTVTTVTLKTAMRGSRNNQRIFPLLLNVQMFFLYTAVGPIAKY